jgi:hypothetical protein
MMRLITVVGDCICKNERDFFCFLLFIANAWRPTAATATTTTTAITTTTAANADSVDSSATTSITGFTSVAIHVS